MTSATLAEPTATPRTAPMFGHPILGVGRAFQTDPIKTFFDAGAACGDVARLRLLFPPFTAHVLRHPDHMQHVFVDRAKNYGKQTRSYGKLRAILGQGLVTSEGDFWRRQRRIANPAFHRERIAHFGDVMVRCMNERIDGWADALAKGDPFDAAHEMMTVTLRIIGLTMLSTDLLADAKTIGQALDDVLHVTIDRIFDPFNLPQLFPTARNRKFSRARATLDGLVNRFIAERRAEPAAAAEAHADLLSMLMAARDPETGEGMSDMQLRDELLTVLGAGHETTANALSWTLDLLSRHPDVARKVRTEVDEVLGTRPATLADLPRLVLTDRVIHESMRLYPPVWSISRAAVEEDVIGGYRIPKGSWVFISPAVNHRDPRFWPNPDAFDPDRFLPEEEAMRPKGSYIPFILGPRKCIGETFALMEARLLLATLVQRTELSLVPGFRTELDPTVTLRPKNGVWMTGKLRQ